MENIENAKAYTEVLEIINNLPYNDYLKIPKEKIEFFEKNKDPNYNFKINIENDISEQEFLPKTHAIVVALFKNYFLNSKQQEKLKEILYLNEMAEEEEKRKKYNPNVFENDNKKTVIQETETKENTELIVYKEENILIKIKNCFKDIMKRIFGNKKGENK